MRNCIIYFVYVLRRHETLLVQTLSGIEDNRFKIGFFSTVIHCSKLTIPSYVSFEPPPNHQHSYCFQPSFLLQYSLQHSSSTSFPQHSQPSCIFQKSQLLQTPIYSRVRVVFKLTPNSENSSRTRTLLLIGARTHPDTLHHGREGGNLFVAEICFGFGELVRA